MSAPPHPIERVLDLRKYGSGSQYLVQRQGAANAEWEAAASVRREAPQLTEAFDKQQQQQQQQLAAAAAAAAATTAEGASEEGVTPVIVTAVGPPEDAAAAREQVRQLAQLVRQQQQELQRLRSSPPLQPQQSRFAKKEPRAQDLREYDGASGAKLDEWLQELSLAVQLFQLNALEASTFGVSRLRGAALQWWLALSATEQAALGDRDSLAAALRSRFQPVTTARVAREQLDRLQQGSRPVNDYIADFQRLRTQLPTMSEDDALYAFERGLRRDLAEKLRVQGVTTVQEAIALAARVGGLLQMAAAGHGRAPASVAQMEIDDVGAGPALEERIQRAVLNAMQAQNGVGASSSSTSSSSGLVVKTQTHRGYLGDRNRGGAARPGRGGGRGPPDVPGVPPAVVQQRWADKQCLRCGTAGHIAAACPNPITAAQPRGF
jgi:Retrotransposon gag protein